MEITLVKTGTADVLYVYHANNVPVKGDQIGYNGKYCFIVECRMWSAENKDSVAITGTVITL